MSKISSIREFIGKNCLRLFFWAIFTSLLCFTIETFFIYTIQLFLFKLDILKETNSFLSQFNYLSIYTVCFIFIVYCFIRSIILSAKSYLICMTGQYFKAYQREKFSRFSLQHPGEIKKNSIVEVFSERVTSAAVTLEQINNLIISGTMSLFFLGFCLYKTPLETVMGIVLLTILILPLQLLNKHLANYGNSSVEEWKNINTNLLNGLYSGSLLKIYQLNKAWFTEISLSMKKYVSIYSKYYVLASIRTNMPLFLGMTTLVGTSLFSKYYTNTPAEDLLIFFYVFVRFSQNISAVNNSSTSVRMNLPGLKRIKKLNNIIDSKSNEWASDKSNIKSLNHKKPKIKINNLSFSYTQKEEIIKNLNIELSSSDILLIKGPSGSGKSTLLGLILNQLSPTSGSIEYNGYKIQTIPNSYASSIGYVGPDPVIFPTTIRENLLFSNSNSITDKEIWNVLETTKLKKLVRSLPNQLSEFLSDKIEISTGQRQRIALARAILRKPSILILDEATANLDSQTEDAFIKNLIDSSRDKIVITVSHRDSFDKHATKRIDL